MVLLILYWYYDASSAIVGNIVADPFKEWLAFLQFYLCFYSSIVGSASVETVILFQGHELHHYLCQQGFTDFEVVKYSSPLQDSKTKKSETLRHQVFFVINPNEILNINLLINILM
jgi:hypothetical protein